MRTIAHMLIAVMVTITYTSYAAADKIACTAVNAGNLTPWAEGACALDHSKSPESWVRGWAQFDVSATRFEVHLNVETDSTTGGPCGTIEATLRDEEGHVLAVAKSDKEICLGGKPPGKSVRYDWIRGQTVPDAVAMKVKKIDVSVTRTRNISSLWGIGPKEIDDAVKLIVKIAAAS